MTDQNSSYIHVCLANEQPATNLAPILDDRLRAKAVWIITTDETMAAAQRLRQAVQGYKISANLVTIKDGWVLEQVESACQQLCAQLAEQNVVLNVSGGNHVMTIAAYRIFSQAGFAVFDVHPQRDHVVWITPPEREDFNCQNRLDLATFIRTTGAEVTPAEHPLQQAQHDQLMPLCEALIHHLDDYEDGVRKLNFLAMRSRATLSTRIPEDLHNHYALQQDILPRFIQAGLLQQRGNDITFLSEAYRAFANGLWLEYYTWQVCQQLQQQRCQHIQDIRTGMEVRRRGSDGQAILNELDVAILADNRLHLIECKTAVQQHKNDHTRSTQTLYKLDTLVDLLGGLHAKGLVVSYFPLSSSSLRRAKDLRITVCAGKELQHLHQHLVSFLQ